MRGNKPRPRHGQRLVVLLGSAVCRRDTSDRGSHPTLRGPGIGCAQIPPSQPEVLAMAEAARRREGLVQRLEKRRVIHTAMLSWYNSIMVTIERVQTGLRIERRLLKVLKALAAYLDLSLGELVEGISLHAFEGK